MRHHGFFSWVREVWACDGCLTTSLHTFAGKSEEWNRSTFGHIFKRKKRNILQLEGVVRTMEQRLSEGLVCLEKKLQVER